jgi:hypothetical protein
MAPLSEVPNVTGPVITVAARHRHPSHRSASPGAKWRGFAGMAQLPHVMVARPSRLS